MNALAVDAGPVVVDLETVAELALHADSVLRRKPPCSSYDEVTTESASLRARSESGAPGASASGVERSCSMPAIPSLERRSAPAACAPHTAPPARAEKPSRSPSAPHSTQLVRCGR